MEGYVAVIHTNNCFVFQLKSDVKSEKYQPRTQFICGEWREVTGVKIKLYVGVLFFLGRIVVRPAFHTEFAISMSEGRHISEGAACICILRNSILAEGF